MKRFKQPNRPGGSIPGSRWRVASMACLALLAVAGVHAQVSGPVIVPEPILPPPVDPVANPAGLRAEAKLHRLDSLKTVPVPIPSNIGDFVKNQAAVVALGKALFWDIQGGSDGMACASCHFHAGADNRSKNQVSPGFNGGNGVFDFFASGPGNGGPNYRLQRADFPFHQLKDETSHELGSNVLNDTDDVASSAGVLDVEFLGLGNKLLPPTLHPFPTQDVFLIQKMVRSGIIPTSEENERIRFSAIPFDPLVNRAFPSYVTEILAVKEVDPKGFFLASGGKKLNTRRVEPRNTPTVINAIFNHRNFWDGRANFNFNGRNPFGPRDPNAKVFELSGTGLAEVPISLDFASLASQAVGPAGSVLEMSAHGRNFLHIARKLFNTVPLLNQQVSPSDSVLGSLSRYVPSVGSPGLKTTYPDMIQKAFNDKWWAAAGTPVTVDGIAYTHMEANFSLFWGIAIMMYERTLVSDQAPFDRFMEGDNTALNSIQRQGLSIFLNQGKCVNCHHGAEFTGAAISQLQRSDNPGQFELIERMIMGDGQPAIYDNGYYNINVRPTAEDSGVGGTDPFGNPLSFSLQATNGPVVDKVGNDLADPSRFHVDPAVPPQPGERVAVNGAFKTPTLRNIDLTGPYFHNGGQLTLEQVVQFYARGTDFHDPNFHDGDVDVEGVPEINGDRTRVRAVAAFLRSLTDPRVAWEKAPFDHPSLPVPHGASGTNTLIYEDKKLPGAAQSDFLLVPMVGARGRSGPIKPFLDGSLAGANGVATNDGLLRLTPPPAPVVVTP